MAQVTITLADTPIGGISISHNFKPAVGATCTPAQAEALDIIARTQRAWGLSALQVVEVDIDAVHHTRAAAPSEGA